MTISSIEIDLSEELKPPPKPVLEQQVEAARNGLSATEVGFLDLTCCCSAGNLMLRVACSLNN